MKSGSTKVQPYPLHAGEGHWRKEKDRTRKRTQATHLSVNHSDTDLEIRAEVVDLKNKVSEGQSAAAENTEKDAEGDLEEDHVVFLQVALCLHRPSRSLGEQTQYSQPLRLGRLEGPCVVTC